MGTVADLLARTDPFTTLPPALLARLESDCQLRTFRQHESLIPYGARPPNELYLVLRGQVEVVLGDDQSSISIRSPGDLVGLTTALAGSVLRGSVRALADSECLAIPLPLLHECMRVPGFAAAFNQILAMRLRDAYRHLGGSGMLRGLERQPLRGSISSVMITPPPTCDRLAVAGAVARAMAARRLSAVVVVDGETPVGIVTEHDLITRVMARNRRPDQVPVHEIMSTPVYTVPPDEPLYRALLTMVRHRIKQLPVIDGGRLVGLAGLAEVSRARGSGALAIVEEIEHAATVADLAHTRGDADRVVEALMREGISPTEVLPVITEFNDRLTRRLLTLAEEVLRAEGWGRPPGEYVWLTMGSAGRQEQFFRTDQDNAIVFANLAPGTDAAAEEYFARLAAVAVDGLVACGWAQCKGDAMATNPIWRRPLAAWEKAIHRWFEFPGDAQVMNAHIFFDFRPVYGNYALAEHLRRFLLEEATVRPTLLRIMAEADMEGGVPISPFGGILTPTWGKRRGRLHLKVQASVHVVDCIRLFALRAGVAEVSTFTRIQRLVEKGELTRQDADWIAEAYRTLLDLRCRLARAAVERGEKPSDEVAVRGLSRIDQTGLQHALAGVNRLQTLTGNSFRLAFA